MDRELAHLFGHDVLQECWRMPTAIRAGQASKVGKLANMLTNANTPRRQRALVDSMPLGDRLLLCRWLADKDYAGDCIRTGK